MRIADDLSRIGDSLWAHISQIPVRGGEQDAAAGQCPACDLAGDCGTSFSLFAITSLMGGTARTAAGPTVKAKA